MNIAEIQESLELYTRERKKLEIKLDQISGQISNLKTMLVTFKEHPEQQTPGRQLDLLDQINSGLL